MKEKLFWHGAWLVREIILPKTKNPKKKSVKINVDLKTK